VERCDRCVERWGRWRGQKRHGISFSFGEKPRKMVVKYSN
jgi:hypothetical protein